MARRPVFIANSEGERFVKTLYVNFDWRPGLSTQQAQKSIASLHAAAAEQFGLTKILEISTKSPLPLGVALSAFNLTFETMRYRRTLTVEAAYQASKVFERGGPYVDLLEKSPREIKRDERLATSGRLVGFRFLGIDWPLNPPTAFYDWLYVNALRKKEALLNSTLQYSAFTDIAFNPERSLNCQAHSAALAVSLARRSMLSDTLGTKEEFLRAVSMPTDLFQETLEQMPGRYHVAQARGSYKTKSKKRSPSMKRGKSMNTFDTLEFPAWDGYRTVKSIVETWRPTTRTREALENELYEFLSRELPDVEVTKAAAERGATVPADILVGNSVALEVKTDIDSDSKYRQLIEQLKHLRDWSGAVIVLLAGRTDPHFAKAIASGAKAEGVKSAKIAVIQKWLL